jgi:hypothetical protein
MSKQLSMLQNDTYKAFVEKFKPKKTTDDCYTPAPIYEAVLSWVIDRYRIDPGKVDRPFWPGGDYESFVYTQGGCVVDNPPFSLLAQIIDFYNENKIKYFLFAPYLTNFQGAEKCCHVVAPCRITYENGAQVNTSFVTNLDPRLIVGDADLYDRVKKAEAEGKQTKSLPRYEYPTNVLTVTDVGYMVTHGVNFEVEKIGALFIRNMDAQKPKSKTIFGGGFLINDELRKKREEAEEQARINASKEKKKESASRVWKLSEREKEIINYLNKGSTDDNL